MIDTVDKYDEHIEHGLIDSHNEAQQRMYELSDQLDLLHKAAEDLDAGIERTQNARQALLLAHPTLRFRRPASAAVSASVQHGTDVQQ